MKLTLVMKGVEKSRSLEALVRHKLHHAFDQFGRWAKDVALAIEDVNGSKGGIDKRCLVTIAVPHQPGIVVEGRGDHLMTVVTDVIDRAAHSLARLRDRRRNRRRDAA